MTLTRIMIATRGEQDSYYEHSLGEEGRAVLARVLGDIEIPTIRHHQVREMLHHLRKSVDESY